MPPSLLLRDPLPSDLPIFFHNQLDPDANHMAAFTAEDPSDRAAFDAHWAKIMADDTVLIKAILYEGQVAGSVLKFEMFDQKQVSYWIGREYWGKGIATRALAQFLEIYTDRPVYGRAAKDNLASIRVLEKNGFILESEEIGYANARGEEIAEVVMRLDSRIVE